jgi:hypothetical protein
MLLRKAFAARREEVRDDEAKLGSSLCGREGRAADHPLVSPPLGLHRVTTTSARKPSGLI